MKNTIIILSLLAFILTMVSCSSGKSGYGCDYSDSESKVKECHQNNTNYVKREITTSDCAT